MSDWEDLVRKLDLKPHPEGGFFRETYRSAHSTAICYLIQPGGRTRETVLSPENPQHVVRAGTWFGAYGGESAYSLRD